MRNENMFIFTLSYNVIAVSNLQNVQISNSLLSTKKRINYFHKVWSKRERIPKQHVSIQFLTIKFYMLFVQNEGNIIPFLKIALHVLYMWYSQIYYFSVLLYWLLFCLLLGEVTGCVIYLNTFRHWRSPTEILQNP